eukprot:TRINITY_DN21950_c0_g1_i1.p1 TRINITY_DN21950_c0_g1~~TRINITY_DN21950_c0_g1_i1.p1  ORF type:complete len:492 (+),score=59.21 TRINITY_DN21950_c0_g1_i1:125-1600(+)
MKETDPLLGLASKDGTRLNLYSWGGASILLSYFSIGLAQALPATPLIYYLVRVRDVSASSLSILGPVASLPWCLKLVYGMISDCFPIYGQRRRPYFIGGWCLYVVLCLLLVVRIEEMRYFVLVFFVFLLAASCLFADVAADSLVVERSKLIEDKDTKGEMQSTCYLLRFTGQVIGNVIGAVYGDPTAPNGLSISTVFLLSASVGFAPLAFSPFLVETASNKELKPISAEIESMIDALSSQAVYQPMSFIVLYNLFQWTNAAWTNFLVEGLQFTEGQLGVLTAAGSVFNWLGVACYKRFYIHTSWRSIYFGTAVLTLVFSLLQAVLVLRMNAVVGLPDVWFALGDSTLATFVAAMQFLPAVMMYVNMCPEGSEGSVYALLTTMSNLSGVCASNISTLITYYWPLDISNTALRSGSFGGLLWLTIFTSVVNPLPLVILNRLPSSFEEQESLRIHGKKNRLIGKLSLGLVALAITWSFVQNSVVAFYSSTKDSK